jgi:anaerobic selenocysteine-containing dehydrogenase
MHPDDLARLGLADGEVARLGNARGEVRLHALASAAVSKGLIVSEGIWPPSSFLDGRGINVLTGDDAIAPFGGAAFHDVRVWAAKG